MVMLHQNLNIVVAMNLCSFFQKCNERGHALGDMVKSELKVHVVTYMMRTQCKLSSIFFHRQKWSSPILLFRIIYRKLNGICLFHIYSPRKKLEEWHLLWMCTCLLLLLNLHLKSNVNLINVLCTLDPVKGGLM